MDVGVRAVSGCPVVGDQARHWAGATPPGWRPLSPIGAGQDGVFGIGPTPRSGRPELRPRPDGPPSPGVEFGRITTADRLSAGETTHPKDYLNGS